MADDGQQPGGGWHLDKRVPLAIIVSILAQTGGIIWWASAIDRRVTELELTKTEIAAEMSARNIVNARQDQAIVRLETQFLGIGDNMRALADAIKEVNAKLDRLVERGPQPAR